MPYGMPADMPQPETDAKMERCVTQLVRTGRDKVSAIRICKNSIIHGDAYKDGN